MYIDKYIDRNSNCKLIELKKFKRILKLNELSKESQLTFDELVSLELVIVAFIVSPLLI